ncbi:MAG: hypothetical protein GQ532_03990 [Methylomarinum sp.]|nr:hypothetical protein [Methylomarinum sp.]
MIMLPKATRVMSDRQPIALIGHDVVGTGGRMGNLPVYHLSYYLEENARLAIIFNIFCAFYFYFYSDIL